MITIGITGNKGFIGTALKEAIVKKYEKTDDQVRCYLLDLPGFDLLHMNAPKVDVLFHLAAQTDVQKSIEDPMVDAKVNILGTIKILKHNPDAKIIIAGSAATDNPQSPYGVSKLAQELYATILHKNAVICRFPNVFAENDHGVVGKFINKKECWVNGDGKQTRTFVYVGDVAEGLIKAMDWKPGVYNFGGAKPVSILALAKATGKKIIFNPALPNEIRKSEMQNTTPNWKPKVDVKNYIIVNVASQRN